MLRPAPLGQAAKVSHMTGGGRRLCEPCPAAGSNFRLKLTHPRTASPRYCAGWGKTNLMALGGLDGAKRLERIVHAVEIPELCGLVVAAGAAAGAGGVERHSGDPLFVALEHDRIGHWQTEWIASIVRQVPVVIVLTLVLVLCGTVPLISLRRAAPNPCLRTTGRPSVVFLIVIAAAVAATAGSSFSNERRP